MRKELITAASVLAMMTGAAYAQGAGNQLNMQQDNKSAVTSPTAPGTAAPSNSMSPGSSSSTATTTAPMGSVSAEELLGKTVVGSDGEEIGEVEDVIMDAASGKARQLVISSGGFLGIGEKQIAVDFSNAQPGADDDEIKLSNLTRAQVKDMAEFEYNDSMTSLNRSRDTSGAGRSTTPAAPATPGMGTGTGTTTGQ
ncbi:PRC-barrel domain-containing protein [Azospirillum sp. RWY-5-1]|uniref:PRC-barrel domain-containing protein n=1 Tax=Azospirillum oleiclasticum TaxID=2735135 RepID=A0ABX2TMD4_9PROT|nr:PRC-barrel domain-containing protein [Azospirillum oleiclasticum]NYZ16995.1 PRC-barrel domain-containing protein [Azospirillum oleiclasticum]NYZ24562.1 PRC-barrel domain-containing protein [Azospirillum oleiclasticum]